jgi:chromosome segregation ATPase
MEMLMSEDSLTVHVLIDLRDEIRSTNQRIDRLEHEVGATRAEVGATRDDLRAEITAVRDHVGQQILASELRMATRVAEQTAATRDLYELLGASLQLRDRIERCEHDIDDLKGRGL